MGTAVLMDGNRYCLQQKHAEPKVMQQDAILHILVTRNFPISTSAVKWLGINKALQIDTTHLLISLTYSSKAIDGPYVDGVSLTYATPRKHLFTYASGYSSDCSYSRINCPCAKYPGDNPPTFVQDDYYCESGSIGNPVGGTVYYTDPLWVSVGW